jgi:cyclophilin family peptidyl-prolyl cis-trans isomerase
MSAFSSMNSATIERGAVTDGMDVVDAIAKVKTGFNGPHQNVPEDPIVIKKVTVA